MTSDGDISVCQSMDQIEMHLPDCPPEVAQRWDQHNKLMYRMSQHIEIAITAYHLIVQVM